VNAEVQNIIDRLADGDDLSINEWTKIIGEDYDTTYLFERADDIRRKYYGTDVYIRGLIEISNYCKNNCLYCGIRRDNESIERYRLSDEEILECASTGYELGFRTFVLQGGEDGAFSTKRVESIVSSIKEKYSDCAVTLSLGEREYEDYKRWFDAGADRYLLRHETANRDHYYMLHPKEMSYENRKRCLYDLKEIGYQVGCGFMVGSPFQRVECLAEDMLFISEFKPDMIGIGPFISHAATPFSDCESGTLDQTLKMLALLRLTCQKALIPATTALGTIHPAGREMGLKVGANVVMPNLSPVGVRDKYSLYDNKICTNEEAAECIRCLERRVESTGYKIVVSRGDSKK
jgi:biotin synthase